MTAVSHTHTASAHLIRSDEEAIAVAEAYAARIAPGAAERDRERSVAREELADLAASGLLGIRVPTAFGGAGVTTATLMEVTRLIAKADPSIAQITQPHHSNVDRLAVFGPDSLRELFFPEVLAGARLGNAIAERGGHNGKDFRTRLTLGDDGQYRLNGTKHYATGSLTADWIVVQALADDDTLLSAFVKRDLDGVTVLDDWGAIGQRTTESGTVTFEDVVVPAHLIRRPSRDTPEGRLSRALSQLIHAALEAGIAAGALEEAAEWVRTRARPTPEAVAGGIEVHAKDPYVLVRFGQLATRVHAAEALTQQVARTIDRYGQLDDITDQHIAEVTTHVARC